MPSSYRILNKWQTYVLWLVNDNDLLLFQLTGPVIGVYKIFNRFSILDLLDVHRGAGGVEAGVRERAPRAIQVSVVFVLGIYWRYWLGIIAILNKFIDSFVLSEIVRDYAIFTINFGRIKHNWEVFFDRP